MATNTDLQVKISAELAGFQQAITQVTSSLRQLRAAAGAGDLSRDTKQTEAAVAGLGRTAGRTRSEIDKLGAAWAPVRQKAENALRPIVALAAQVGAALAFREVARIADQTTAIAARLRIATTSQDEFNRAQRELFTIAQRNQAPIADLTTLYARLAPAIRRLNGTQQDSLDVSEAVALSLRITGASAQEQSSAILQFSQAMASGVLRGEEFNAVNEAAPRLLDALAESLNVSKGELRSLAEQGRLTADIVSRGLIRQLGTLRREAETLPKTIGGAVTQLGNSFRQLVSSTPQVGTAMQAIVTVINAVAANLSTLITVVAATAAAFAAWKIGATVAAIVTFVGEAGGLLAVLTKIGAVLLSPAGVVAGVLALAAAIGLLVANSKKLADLPDDELERRFAASIDANEANDLAAELQRRREARAAAAELAREGNRAGVLGQAGKPPLLDGTKRITELRKVFDAELALLADRIEREKRLNEQAREDGIRGFRDYFAEKARLEQASLDNTERRIRAEIAAINSAIAANRAEARDQRSTPQQKEQAEKRLFDLVNDRRKLETDLTIVGRDRAEISARIAREEERALKAVRDQLAEADRRLKRDLGQETLGDIQSRVADEFRGLREAEFDATGDTAQSDQLAALEVRRQAVERLERQFSGLQASIVSEEQLARAQFEAGQLSIGEYERRLLQARQNGVPALQAIRDEFALISEGIPGATELLQQFDAAILTLGTSAQGPVQQAIQGLRASFLELSQSFVGDAVRAGVDSLTNFFATIGDGSKSAGEKLRDFVRSFAQSMAQIAARALATLLVLQLLEAIFPGAGRLVAASGGTAASVLHSGGRVRASGGGRTRQVDPLLFLAAPRLHSGTVPGLKPDEVPAILQDGETVFSREQTAAMGRAGGGGPPIRIINTFEPADVVQQYLQTSAGEKAIMNAIERNQRGVQQVLTG